MISRYLKYYRKNRERCAAEALARYHANGGRERQKDRRATVRRFISRFKLQRGCKVCGYRAYAEALDFDHVRGTKKYDIASCGNIRREELLLEIAKCDVLCSNCHRVRTRRRLKRRPSTL